MWTSWAIVYSDECYDDVMTVPGMVHDPKRGVPIYHGTLDNFSRYFPGVFTVSVDGRYIQVGEVTGD
jgi:hypothetical protein